jgi:hypothetical protein
MLEDGSYKNEETYPFICPKCKGFYECDVVVNGLCICISCEPDLYYQPDRLNPETILNDE